MNKRILFPFALALCSTLLVIGNSSFSKPVKPKPVNHNGIVWADTIKDFGSVNMGPELTYKFSFTNKTKKIIAIKSAQPGCSCTVSEFTQDPIKKGKKGYVTAKYTTQNHQGFFHKGIKVTFDDGTWQSLIITGTVVTP